MDEKLKKRVDILAEELIKFPPEAIDQLREFLTRHSYATRLDAHNDLRNVTGIANTCAKTDLVLLSGRDVMDRSGKAIIPIDQILCSVIVETLHSLRIWELYPSLILSL